MNEHTMGMLLGVVVGLLVGIILVILILKMTKTDGAIRCKYDERQEKARGKAYKYGFFAFLIFNMIYAMLQACIPELPVTSETGILIVTLCALLVFITYCIWNDAYFSINENRRKVMIAFVIVLVLNLWIGIVNLISGRMLENGKLGIHSLNLLCAIMFLVVFIVLAVKNVCKETEAEEEE